jgi:hypothetical protein
MTYYIPIELIYKIMEFLDPKTLLIFGKCSKIFRNEVKNRYKVYFKRFVKIYPTIFKQNNPNEIVFQNNCLLAYLQDIGFEYPKIDFIDKKPSSKYYDLARKIIVLKKIGIKTFNCRQIVRETDNIDDIIYFKKKGFEDNYLLMCNKLNQNDKKNIVKLLENGIIHHYCFEIVKNFDDVDRVIYLKQQGFSDYHSIHIAQKFKSFRDVIILKNAGFNDYNCIEIALQMTDFKNVIRLKEAGFKDVYCLEGAATLENLENAIKLKNVGFDDYFSINYSKYVDDNEIIKLMNLKIRGYRDTECGNILKIEMI